MMPAHVLAFLTSWLRYYKTPEANIAQYSQRCTRLRPGESLPCPKCFVNPAGQHREHPLTVQPAEHGFEQMFCPHCKTHFEVPELLA